MQPASQFEPPQSFVDPRSVDEFRENLWPARTGEEPPPIGTTDRHERRCIEFLAAYYTVNCRQADLLAARKQGASESEIALRLKTVSDAIDAVDRLEDRFSPVGFYGEPTMDGVFYRSIGFNRPEVPRILSPPGTHSSHIAIPGLNDIPAEELRGPVVITRWNHGKVDL
jgi:hypothetical protein